MRLWVWIRQIIALPRIIEAQASSQAALTKRFDEMQELHDDLVRQHGIQQKDLLKQLADLRAIVANLDTQQKQRPAVARSMADIRQFIGAIDAD